RMQSSPFLPFIVSLPGVPRMSSSAFVPPPPSTSVVTVMPAHAAGLSASGVIGVTTLAALEVGTPFPAVNAAVENTRSAAPAAPTASSARTTLLHFGLRGGCAAETRDEHQHDGDHRRDDRRVHDVRDVPERGEVHAGRPDQVCPVRRLRVEEVVVVALERV